MTQEWQPLLEEIESIKQQMTEIYRATLQASTIVLPYSHYTEEQKKLAGIVPVGKEPTHE